MFNKFVCSYDSIENTARGMDMSRPGAAPVTAPGWTAKDKKGVALVDCDIHHNFKSASELMPYLPKFYQEHLIDQGLFGLTT